MRTGQGAEGRAGTRAASAVLLPADLPADDLTRLSAAAEYVRVRESDALLPLLLPGLDGPELRTLTERCRFEHAALVVFPPDPRALRADLAACGLTAAAPPRPSVVVRERLALRHRRDAKDLDVRILRPGAYGPDGSRRVVEVFTLVVPPGSALTAIAAHERVHEHEAHLAFEVDRPDGPALRGLCASFVRHGAVADGGGYNPHENGTVLYFTAPAAANAGYRRVELHADGDHRDVLAAHLDGHRARRPATNDRGPRRQRGSP
ncbi:hypothetical protein [Streptomyces sp. NPDC050504]|uniref:hypothetical protein n=1 Tax=Streptomyces sp. NPDC050504 TaxID=3365618 RepID=UPI0037AEAEA5